MVWILPLLSQHKVTWPSWHIISLLFVFILLLVRRIFALGNSFLRRLLSIVLQVDAESICALTTLDFLPCMRCRLEKIFSCKVCCVALRDETFLANVFRDKSRLLLSRLSPCSTPVDRREMAGDATFSTYFSHCRAVLLTGLLMFPTTPKTLWWLQRFACEVDLLLLSILGYFHQLIRRGRGYLECFGGFDYFS